MEHDDLPIGTIFSRREALTLAAKAGVGLAVGGLFTLSSGRGAQQHANIIASPALTEGPFFVDEKLDRSNLVTGTTRKSVAHGTPLTLELTVSKLASDQLQPFAGCQVDIWHCDAAGVYSDENNPMNHEDTEHQTWLRGFQVTDAKGVAKFQTIVPGWYPGRTAHVHFKVRRFSPQQQVTADFTSQLFFHEADLKLVYAKPPYTGQDVPPGTNLRDGIFAERQVDGTVAGDRLLLNLRPEPAGYSAKYAIVLSGPTNWSMF